jgi:hypothetical protein
MLTQAIKEGALAASDRQHQGLALAVQHNEFKKVRQV